MAYHALENERKLEKYQDVKVPDWFKNETGLGLFLHWGPWSTKFWSTCGWSYWRNRENVSMEEYKKQIGHFNPDKYDPDIWMKAARRAGFAYAVITSRHIDGYELWPTNIENDWGTKGYMNGRDLLKPYVEACRNNDIKVGFYFAGTDYFWNPKGWPYPGFPYEKKKAPDGSPHGAFNDIQKYMDIMFYKNVYPALEELMTRYGKIDVLWFDGLYWPPSDSRPFELEKMIRSHSCDELEGWMKHSRESVENVKAGPWPEQSNVPVTTKGNAWYLFGWPQNSKGEFDETLADKQNAPTKYEYEPIDKKLIVKDVKKPKNAVLLHNGKELAFDYKEKTLTIVIPANMTTKLVDVVKVEF